MINDAAVATDASRIRTTGRRSQGVALAA